MNELVLLSAFSLPLFATLIIHFAFLYLRKQETLYTIKKNLEMKENSRYFYILHHWNGLFNSTWSYHDKFSLLLELKTIMGSVRSVEKKGENAGT